MSYKILNDATRNENHGYESLSDDYAYYDGNANTYLAPDWKGPGWYRFQSPAGVKMPENAVAIQHCGTNIAHWLNGAHPTVVGETVTRTSCGHWSSNTCYKTVSIQIKKCGNYFLYYLPNVPQDYGRYCATNN